METDIKLSFCISIFLGNIGGPIPPQLQQQQQQQQGQGQGQVSNQSMEFDQMSTAMMNQVGNQMQGNQLQGGEQMRKKSALIQEQVR